MGKREEDRLFFYFSSDGEGRKSVPSSEERGKEEGKETFHCRIAFSTSLRKKRGKAIELKGKKGG